jgi:HK97 gp10 family phage protein
MAGEYDELLGRLDSLKTVTRKKALKKSLRAMGELMRDAIVAIAPEQVENAHGVLKPGQLKADIRVSVHVADDENAADDSDRVTIGPTRKTIDIATDVEIGHSNRPRTVPRPVPRTESTPAHPFVRPAFDATEEQAVTLFQETMAAEIAKVMNA